MKEELEHLKFIKICNIDARVFLKIHKANKEHISISNADEWLACYHGEKIIGVVGILTFKNLTRIKSFYVVKEFRNKGVGTKLLDKTLKSYLKYTAFATKYSFNLFIKNGFIPQCKIKNEITFLVRDVQNEKSSL
jgi:GNAT superfamily N-acetyltransferase